MGTERSRGTIARRKILIASGATGAVVGSGLIGRWSNGGTSGGSFGDGVNLQPSYFCGGEQDIGWDLMNQYPAIETVRIEIEPFSFGDVDTTVEDARRWIDEATENGYEVIATYHHHPDDGSADPAALQRAADFWVDHYGTLSRNSSVTINLMNEWGDHSVSASAYASAYTDAIGTVRTATSYTGPIVCDAPGWGQGTHRLASAVEDIDDDDLVLSAHVYPNGYNATTGEWLRPAHLNVMDETDYPCILGEFGKHTPTAFSENTGADWSAIVDHARDLGWPVVGWAWNGDGTAEKMNMVDPHWGEECQGPYSESSYFAVVYDKLGDSGGGDGDDGSNGEPTAAITTDATDPSIGEAVTFDASDSSTGDGTIERYEWAFGDGTTATGERVEHAFDDAGEYEVRLTVTDDAAATDAETVTVRVTNGAASGPDAPATIEAVERTTSSITLEWDGVDGADRYVVSVDGSVDHETSETSTTVGGLEADTHYEIGVAAVDGGSKSDPRTISVSTGDGAGDGAPGGDDGSAGDDGNDGTDDSNERHVAEIRPSTTSASVGERIDFVVADNTTDRDAWITALQWDFGDGTTADGWYVAYVYGSPGTYTVALTATDSAGTTTTHEITISVSRHRRRRPAIPADRPRER
ncbi:PKD domain-containing protein [Natrinema caseinilyticum]|uniref:PKD domain-containing protein n=1 Tax=Natrinema caseinilyticum TaxID=2961570 RepID=UPI0020C5686F|nr:PKD domain-containing protein [Natrinema caseinilyticum]